MGARQKLNAAHFNGSILLAAFVGLLTGSWGIFLFAAIGFLILSVHAGTIRPGSRGPRRRG